jgi:hypothetical protein
MDADNSSSPRKKLYLVTGPATEILGNESFSGELNDAHSMDFFYKAKSKLLTSDKVYLEGIFVYRDKDLAVILHQNQAGDEAKRLLTCVDSTGKELWTLASDQMFPEMDVKADDSFSVIFFMQDRFMGERAGGLFLFKMSEVGIIAVDIKSGQKVWEFRT